MTEARALTWLRIASLAPLAGGLALYAAHEPTRTALDTGVSALVHGDLPALRRWGSALGGYAILGTTVLMVVQAIAAPIPAVLVTVTNSWLFGWFQGGLLSCAQATLAALLCFALARAFGEPLVARLMPARALKKAEAFMLEHGAAAILVARLMPLVPFDPISYVAGLTRMRWTSFTWATLLGQIPAGLAYSYLGAQIDRPSQFAISFAGVMLGLIAAGALARRTLTGRGRDKMKDPR
jgi:uncharacterized membrane protein YdjX (TVP38/TMEM64 family)